MKKVFVLLILVAVAMAVNLTQVQTVLAPLEDKIVTNQPSLNISSSSGPTENMPNIGRVEVIGWTDYDWLFNGPSYSNCRIDPVANGIHASWMWRIGTIPRNTRYNFYDFSSRTWNWVDGVTAYSITTGFGGMDYDPITGNVVICAHGTPTGGVLSPQVARDVSPGAGLFEYSAPTFSSLWPPVGVTNNQMIHIAPISNDAAALRDTLYYIRMTAWGNWSAPLLIHDATAIPNFPNQNITASKTSNKVAVLWQCSEDARSRAFYRMSTDGGANWGAQTQIPFPPVVAPMTIPEYGISSLYGIFDNSDNLRIVASVSDTARTMPAQIWLYSPTLANPWTLVHNYSAETLTAPVGYNAIFATRPTLAQASGATGNFYVCWEQFDSLNYEPATTLARADIHVAELTNNGATVSRKGRITAPNTTSKRFPSIGGIRSDTIIVMYMVDSIAGSIVQGQGPLTVNPMVVHRLHRLSLPPAAIEEQNPMPPYEFTLHSALPNPFSNNTRISYSLPAAGNVDLTVYDILGRPVKTLASGRKTAGNHTAYWDGRTSTDKQAKAGIYFYTLKTSDKSISRKIIKTN